MPVALRVPLMERRPACPLVLPFRGAGWIDAGTACHLTRRIEAPLGASGGITPRGTARSIYRMGRRQVPLYQPVTLSGMAAPVFPARWAAASQLARFSDKARSNRLGAAGSRRLFDD